MEIVEEQSLGIFPTGDYVRDVTLCSRDNRSEVPVRWVRRTPVSTSLNFGQENARIAEGLKDADVVISEGNIDLNETCRLREICAQHAVIDLIPNWGA